MSGKRPKESPTIVGGQPVGKQGGSTGLPHGIESIVLLAAADESFRRDFAADREGALERAGITLSSPERAIFKTIGDGELFAIAGSVRKAKPKGAKRTLLATAASLAALASLTTAAPKSRAAGDDAPDQRPALGQLDSTGEESAEKESDWTPTPTQTYRTLGIQPETPTPTATEGIRGIQPDTPTPTEPAVEGIRPDTPTPTREPTATPAGILPDTPTPTATPVGIWPDTPTPTATPTRDPADMNRDGAVDSEDLFLFLQQWYKGKGARE